MSLAHALLKSYDAAQRDGLVDRAREDPKQPILLPIYHSSTRSDGKNIFEIVLNNEGKFLGGDFLPEQIYTAYPVTEDSLSRSSGAVARPLVDELSYIDPVPGGKKDGLYLEALQKWVLEVEDPIVKTFLEKIEHLVSTQSIGQLIAKSVAKGADFDYDAEQHVLEVHSVEKGKYKTKSHKLAKVIITFKIMDFYNGVDCSVSDYRELHDAHIAYQEMLIEMMPKNICNLTGEKAYCSTKHRGLMGTAKIITAGTDSKNLETYYGRFSSRSEVIQVSYEASSKIHNMIKYLLENKNNATRLSFKKGKSGGDPAVLCVWFSDDIENQREMDILRPQEVMPSDLSLLLDEDEDASYVLGGTVTQNAGSSAKGYKRDFDANAKVYILILDKPNDGRISIKYFRALSQDAFYENMENWYESFSWYYYDIGLEQYTRQSPILPRIADVLFGAEYKSDNRTVLKMADGKNKYKETLITSLLPCIVEGAPLPQRYAKAAFSNVKMRQKYSETWPSVLAMCCATLSKYREDRFNERMDDQLIEESRQTRDYLYGRILAVLEKAEVDAVGDDANRLTNAERFWNHYTTAPATTLKTLMDKMRPYWNRLKRNKPGLYFTFQKEIEQCLSLMSTREDGSSKKALNEDFIFGYYAQRKKNFTKKDNKQSENVEVES